MLKEAKDKYPDLQGVSSGAVASTYQKLRVENVCKRLGLQSLAYLWGYDQTKLIQEMIEKQMTAIIVKICSFGLSDKHLGRTIKENYDEFIKLRD